jgi:hypothetical protein
LVVFVDESSEPVLPLDTLGWSVGGDLADVGSGRWRGERRFLVEGLVRPMRVVVLDVLVEDGQEVVLVDDQ